MRKEFNKRLFSFIFLFIFFVKMGIAVAPLIAITLDARSVYAVIMQIEIESSANSDKVKETAKEYFHNYIIANFPNAAQLLKNNHLVIEDAVHFRTFYPSVPTPPPNV